MGTKREQVAPKSNPAIDCWHIRGPDADGFAWLEWDCGAGQQTMNLGAAQEVGDKLAKWLERMDFGE